LPQSRVFVVCCNVPGEMWGQGGSTFA